MPDYRLQAEGYRLEVTDHKRGGVVAPNSLQAVASSLS
jgi:hypothetical protein